MVLLLSPLRPFKGSYCVEALFPWGIPDGQLRKVVRLLQCGYGFSAHSYAARSVS